MNKLLLIVLLVVLSVACSPFYVMRAAYEQSIILLTREDIASIIKTPQSEMPPEDLGKLQIVLDARDFAEEIGLKAKGSFKTFTKLRRDTLAWVLVASRPDSFSLFTWWFPFVGSVPYKGYFAESDAQQAARNFEEMGYETWVRGTSAISTLGWFDDPLLSSTLKHDKVRLVNTVIHECLHNTFWVDGSVDFNESLANFVGNQGAIEFFERAGHKCTGLNCGESVSLHQSARETLDAELRFSVFIEELFRQLSELYSSAKSREEKLTERSEVFERLVAPIRQRNPKMSILTTINNAEIIQLKLYYTKLDLFQKLFEKLGKSWPKFLATVRELPSDGKGDIWLALEAAIKEGA